MHRHRVVLPAVLVIGLLAPHAARGDGPDFSTLIGSVEKIDQDTLKVKPADKAKKTLELKVTGTSKFHLLAPQVLRGQDRHHPAPRPRSPTWPPASRLPSSIPRPTRKTSCSRP